MGITITKHDLATGEIIQVLTLLNPADVPLNIESGEGWVTGRLDYRTQYVDVQSGLAADRPTLPAPSASYDLTALPAGSVVTARNEDGDEQQFTELTEALTLTDPGTYWITVEPPFPYQPIRDAEVTVA